MSFVHGLEDFLHVVHGFVEFTQLAISEVLVVFQVPLSSAIVITIVVALSWEIDPLWMAELVTHEVEI